LNEPSRRPTGAAAPPPLDTRPGQPSSPHPPAVPVPARPRLAGWLTAATCIATGRPGRARHGRHHARASVKKSPTRPRAVAIIAGALLLLPRRLQSDDGLGRTTYVARGRVLSANSWYASGMCRAPAGRPASGWHVTPPPEPLVLRHSHTQETEARRIAFRDCPLQKLQAQQCRRSTDLAYASICLLLCMHSLHSLVGLSRTVVDTYREL
jgi:hypothetical protein